MTRGTWLAIGAGGVAAATLAAAVVMDVWGASDREQDCAEVRAILDARHAPRTSGLPRRYWDYGDGPKHAPADAALSPLERLQRVHYRDPAVREAVLDYVGTGGSSGWTLYTPYSTSAAPLADDKLRELCDLPRQTVIEAR